MVYLIAIVIILYLVRVWNKYSYSLVFLSVIFSMLTIGVVVMFNTILGIVLMDVPSNQVNEQEVLLYTNEITNEYYIVNSEGELITKDIMYEINNEITEPMAKEIDRRVDFGIWLIPMNHTDYKILIPTS